jgi:hypothetical protein
MLRSPFVYKVGTFTEQLLAASWGILRNNSFLQGGGIYGTTPCCMVWTFRGRQLAAAHPRATVGGHSIIGVLVAVGEREKNAVSLHM